MRESIAIFPLISYVLAIGCTNAGDADSNAPGLTASSPTVTAQPNGGDVSSTPIGPSAPSPATVANPEDTAPGAPLPTQTASGGTGGLGNGSAGDTGSSAGGEASLGGGSSGGSATVGLGGTSSAGQGGGSMPDDAGVAGGNTAGAGGYPVLDPGTEGDGPLPEIGPPFSDVNLDMRDVPHGRVYRLSMSSSDSQIYPGLNGPYTRDIDVYIPAQYADGAEAPFIVVQDGPGYTNRMQRALDNLISEGEAPALIAIMVDNGGGDSIGSQRGLEYDTMNDVYATFVDTELLPFVLSNDAIRADYPNIALTENPEGRAAMGCSSGAAAAFTMAWFGHDRYRRVLSYSGTFVDQQDPAVPSYPNGAWEYHEHLIAEQSPNKPIRVYLEVGENDLGANDPESTLHNWVLANQRMAEVLGEKGYHYQYQFARSAGHCDGGVIGQTLYEALRWLWRGYPI